ncbi:GTP binding protein [Coemansia sp. RSA 2336]|nr:GTP binding protein [Coemansia sp. RSA 2336]
MTTRRDTMYSEDIAGAGKCSVSVLQEGVTKLPPEVDKAGNVEYKTKLDNITSTRATHLATQLQWRLSEGDGYAIYVIGVHDDGDVVGITDEEFQSTIDTIKNMAQQLENTRIVSIEKRTVDSQGSRVVAEVHLSQKMPLPQTELRIAVLGDHGAGKSTVLGCITYNEEDDGRGKARLNLMRHQHELESGRTSSITLTAIGYSADGHVQNYANNRSAEDIHQRSQRVVTFIDTCGHTKHLKTTARALTGYTPHVFCIVIPADVTSISAATLEYVQIAAAFRAPLMIVISKMDIADKTGFGIMMRHLMSALDARLPNRSQCVVTESAAHQSLADDIMKLNVVPIFTTSAVRTVGFSELVAVMGSLHPDLPDKRSADREPFEFHVEDLYSIDSVGSVVTGWVRSGTVSSSSNAQLAIGPDSAGSFTDIDITSIHALRIPTEAAMARMSASLAIQTRSAVAIQKGMVVVDARMLETAKRHIRTTFAATVTLLSGDIAANQDVIIHIRAAYHLATVVEIATDEADQGSSGSCGKATIELKLAESEYIAPGTPIVARDGRSLIFAGHVALI